MNSPLAKLGIGTAQFPLEEGPGLRGRSPAEQVKDILQIAARARLAVLDVASRAPQNEATLGQLMPRPVPFQMAISTVRADKGPDVVERELVASLRRLGVESCETVLVPTASDLFGDNGLALWTRLLRLKLLAKALYEINYEAEFRPTWIGAPVWGVLSILDTMDRSA